MKILLTGATGLIGRELGKELVLRGHTLSVVSRSRSKAQTELPFPAEIFEGDLRRQPLSDLKADGRSFDAVISLAGENVSAGRWTESFKNELRESRISMTRNLRESLSPTQTMISASGVGVYGDRGDEVLSEDSSPGADFLAQLCQDWEAESAKVSADRHVSLRLGMVLSQRGGALTKMLLPFRAGVGGIIADGQQWMSWIHIVDVVQAICWILETRALKGGINLVSPHPVRNREFTSALGAAIGKPTLLPVPGFALKVLYGGFADAVLGSQQVHPERLLASGFRFQYPKITDALENVLGHLRNGEDLLIADQFIPRKKEEIFPFFAEAQNLAEITPPILKFQITGVSEGPMQQGTLINYRLKIHGVPVNWQTRIEKWNPSVHFVDSQIKGPYRSWIHEHRFQDMAHGTLMTDKVRYRLPLGYLGWLGAGAFVKRDVDQIFSYRRDQVAKLF